MASLERRLAETRARLDELGAGIERQRREKKELDIEIAIRKGAFVYGQINVYGVTTKSERHKRSYWTRTADGNGIGGRKAPVPYGS